MNNDILITTEAIPVAEQAVFADVIEIKNINEDGSVDSSVADETRVGINIYLIILCYFFSEEIESQWGRSCLL